MNKRLTISLTMVVLLLAAVFAIRYPERVASLAFIGVPHRMASKLQRAARWTLPSTAARQVR